MPSVWWPPAGHGINSFEMIEVKTHKFLSDQEFFVTQKSFGPLQDNLRLGTASRLRENFDI